MVVNKKKEECTIHREFGVWSNTCYLVRKIAQYCPVLIVGITFSVICNSVNSYYWGILSKYIIALIEKHSGGPEAVRELIRLALIAGAVALALGVGATVSNNRRWFYIFTMRTHLLTERITKVLKLRYDMLERPDILDMAERAERAMGGGNGVEGMLSLFTQLATSLCTVAVTFTTVTILDWRLIILLIGLAIVQFLYFRHIMKRNKEEVWDKWAPTNRKRNYMERVTQDFEYSKDIRLFDLSAFLAGKQREVFAEREKLMDLNYNLWSYHSLVVELIYVIAKAAIYAVLFYTVLMKGLFIGDYTMYLAMTMAFSQALLNIFHRFGDYRKASVETDDFRSFMEFEIEDDEADALDLPECAEYEIEFHDVSYRYAKSDFDALSGFSLRIASGEKLAVVGLNGAGKSTMIKLLLRLYDPTEGYITLNGVDIRHYRRKDYYRLFAPVFQDVEIFAFPVLQNVSMAAIDGTDRSLVEKSLKEADLWDKIETLTRGIDTPLTNIAEDDGVNLSGGEQQKLALARALYKGGKIVVLDEPTSALDAIAEQRLYENFNEMIGDRSAVYISHRLASTQFCDRIALFKDGKLTEYGTHDELMSRNGAYADMFNTQAQYYRDEQDRRKAFEGEEVKNDE